MAPIGPSCSRETDFSRCYGGKSLRLPGKKPATQIIKRQKVPRLKLKDHSKMKKNAFSSEQSIHLVTVGTTPAGVKDDVIDALVKDLATMNPTRIIVLATSDSHENAKRLLNDLGMKSRQQSRVRLLKSAQSLEEAYQVTNEEIARLINKGTKKEDIILHYTAGTKVMSAGAVLAAVNHDIKSLRYIFSEGRRKKSIPLMTSTSSVLGDKQLRMALTLFRELRFDSARDILELLDDSLLEPKQSALRTCLTDLAQAYHAWDRFQVQEFLKKYKQHSSQLGSHRSLKDFKIAPAVRKSLEKIESAATTRGQYPEELLIDLFNNSIRRLVEAHPDDAIIRLHRAAGLYAQTLLCQEFGIQPDDVDIRKVPPRFRMSFEAERRLEDVKIKLGLRKSYELLEVLGHPIGQEARNRHRFQELLRDRRHLVLAHGTKPASMKQALDFLFEVRELLYLNIDDFDLRAAKLQFPWLDNQQILEDLKKEHLKEG